MRGLGLGIAIFLAGMRLSSAVEGQIDARTLCPVVISAFDRKDATQMQEFLRFVQNVFDELDADSREKGEPALKARLIDTSSWVIAASIQRRQFTMRPQLPIEA
jgi:hypothetical protein